MADKENKLKQSRRRHFIFAIDFDNKAFLNENRKFKSLFVSVTFISLLPIEDEQKRVIIAMTRQALQFHRRKRFSAPFLMLLYSINLSRNF